MTNQNEAERLQAIVNSAASLARSVEPPTDQWPEILRRIDDGRVIPLHAEMSARRNGAADLSHRGHTGPRRYLVAAAVLILFVGAALVVTRPLDHRQGAPPVTVTPTALVKAPIAPQSAPPSQRTPVRPLNVPARTVSSIDIERVRVLGAFNAYEDAARELSWSLESRRTQLDPRTRAVLDTCLRQIDNAITEARAALARNPGNDIVSDFLRSSYRQKLYLLKRTVEGPLRTL